MRLSVPEGLENAYLELQILLDLIHTRQSHIDLYRADANQTGRHFSPISQADMRRLIDAYRLPEVLREAERRGIVEIDRHYIVGEKSRGYRLSEAYFNRPTVTVEIGGKSGRRVERARAYDYKPRNAIQRKIGEWVKRLTVDMEGVRAATANLPADQMELYRRLAGLIDDGRIFFVCDPFGRRVHTNISNFPKVLRPFLRIDGKRLVNVDIATSQPYFLALYLLQREEKVAKPSNKPLPSQIPDSPFYDVGFVQSVCNGTLYEKINFGTREENKIAVLTVLFCKRHRSLSPEEEAFRDAFPKTFATIQDVKKGDRKRLAKVLQRTEAALMIDQVCTGIAKARPDCPIITIHDSILTTEEHADFVRDAIRREASVDGLTPTVRIER